MLITRSKVSEGVGDGEGEEEGVTLPRPLLGRGLRLDVQDWWWDMWGCLLEEARADVAKHRSSARALRSGAMHHYQRYFVFSRY